MTHKKRYVDMSIPRQKFREIVLQLLFCDQYLDATEKEVCSFFMRLLKTTKKNVKDAIIYKNLIKEKLSNLDEKIKNISNAYSFERISSVEVMILRLGFFEIYYDDSIPTKVAIAEAIRLCRKFAKPESSKFVNAIMDQSIKK
jgi:N utilization substance protein B